ncbi:MULTISPECIES: hypothetical protein [Streptococcus]|jgi:hypothetical protein|uniref:Cell division protein DivIVA n=2 Tax=Streptococcus cristatus TaxID=45634 RepID=A0A3R9M5H7_STRCR|nr:hypothetical protein [Streptococcus cristatus]RKW07690.1 MAG: hypothetical protein D8H99_02270 [Streptococcus sp.]EGU66699.1 conserved domain protein [Streptococcus cristatus ATCC 51100]KJQ57408.1 hypothetical protein TZ85_01746 [Streptococcus cristatus]MCG7330035.1 hypothetical protein [Streptococcus cristatus]MCY7221531.1 hypothetical protein [Streptococcus cristatus]
MRLKKTLFGNYRAKEVEEYIESLEEGFDSEIRKKNEKIESLRKKIDALKNQEREIGEAVVYAKSLIIEAHEKAEKEAQEVLEKAQKDFLQVRSSILEEIDELTKKRLETEQLYKAQKEKIKELLSQIGQILDEETLEGQIDIASLIEEASEDDEFASIFDTPLEEDEATRLFDTPLEEDEAPNEQVEAESLFDEASLEAHEEEVNESDIFGEEEVPVEISAPQKEVVNIEQTFAKTGTDSSVPVTYFTSPVKKSKDEDKEKGKKKKGKIIKRLSRIKKDNLL